MSLETTIDRLALRTRPSGSSLMHQYWGKLLFMHWAIDAELLRPLIPSQLSIDTFDGKAWIGVVPFTMWGIRASFLPPIPGTSAFHELNVRTYVHFKGLPGVWFFSLDAANSLAVWGARAFYYLPYFNAEMSLEQQGSRIGYSSTRNDGRGPAADLRAAWTIGECLAQARPGSLEFFLTERYCLYSYRRGQLYRSHLSPTLAAEKRDSRFLPIDDDRIARSWRAGGRAFVALFGIDWRGHLVAEEGLSSLSVASVSPW